MIHLVIYQCKQITIRCPKSQSNKTQVEIYRIGHTCIKNIHTHTSIHIIFIHMYMHVLMYILYTHIFHSMWTSQTSMRYVWEAE